MPLANDPSARAVLTKNRRKPASASFELVAAASRGAGARHATHSTLARMAALHWIMTNRANLDRRTEFCAAHFLTLHSCPATFHQLFNLGLTCHGCVSGGSHGQCAMGGAIFDSNLRVAA